MQEGKKFVIGRIMRHIFWKVVNDRDKFDVYLWKQLASGAINLKSSGSVESKHDVEQ